MKRHQTNRKARRRSQAASGQCPAEGDRAHVLRGVVLHRHRHIGEVSQSLHGHRAGGVGALSRRIPDRIHFHQSVDRAGADCARSGPGCNSAARSCLLLSTILNIFALRYLQLDETMSILFATPLLGGGVFDTVPRRKDRSASVGGDHRRFYRRPDHHATRASDTCTRLRLLTVIGTILLRALQHQYAHSVNDRFQRHDVVLFKLCSAPW